MNWSEHIQSFENFLLLEKGLSKNSIEAYLNDLRKFTQFLKIEGVELEINIIDTVHITSFLAYLNDLELSPYSQARILSGIKAFFKYLIIDEFLVVDPSIVVEAPKLGRKLPDVLEVHEIDELFKAIDLSTPEGFRNRAMLETLYSSGLRVSELINMQVGDVYFNEGYLKVIGKGNKERYVPIGREALKYNKIYLDEVRVHVPIKKDFDSFLYLNRRGKYLTRVMIFTIIKNLSSAVGLTKKISPHTFRHSFATHLVEGGADLRAVQEMLGHESITTTEIYAHLDKSYLKQVIKDFHPRS